MDIDLLIIVGVCAALTIVAGKWVWQWWRDRKILQLIASREGPTFPAEIARLEAVPGIDPPADEAEWVVWDSLTRIRAKNVSALWRYWSALRRRRAAQTIGAEEYRALLQRLLEVYDRQWNDYLEGAKRMYGHDRVTCLENMLHP